MLSKAIVDSIERKYYKYLILESRNKVLDFVVLGPRYWWFFISGMKRWGKN